MLPKTLYFLGNTSTIRNVGLIGEVISGKTSVGGLVGVNEGSITNSYSIGTVSGTSNVGGLVGYNYSGASITNSSSSSVVGGTSNVGGLAGWNAGALTNSYASGSVSGDNHVGGLVGVNSSSLSNSYSSGTVSGNFWTGGLVGYNYYGSISNSHYDVDNVSITLNGATGHYLTTGGLYAAQYVDWLANGLSLNINNYLSQDGGGYYTLSTTQNLKDLLGFADVGGLKFKLTADIDLASLPDWYIPEFSAAEFNGGGHILSTLAINQPFNDRLGVIGYLAVDSTLTQLGLTNAQVSGYTLSGGVGGIGSLVGISYGSVSNSYSNGGAISGTNRVGGLVGTNRGSVSNSFSTGLTSGTGDYVGGLTGINYGSIDSSYSSSVVNGLNYVGGLVGRNYASISSGVARIVNSYSNGLVSGTLYVGGLVGYNNPATAPLPPTFIPVAAGFISNSYWNTETSGQTVVGIGGGTNAGAIPLTTAQMMTQASFTDWSIAATGGSSATWRIYDGSTYPLLRSFLTPLTVTAMSGSRDYDGTATGIGVSYSLTPDPSKVDVSTLIYTGASKDVGSYTITPAGLYSNQQGYDISYADGALTINPLTIDQTILQQTTVATTQSITAGSTDTGTVPPADVPGGLANLSTNTGNIGGLPGTFGGNDTSTPASDSTSGGTSGSGITTDSGNAGSGGGSQRASSDDKGSDGSGKKDDSTKQDDKDKSEGDNGKKDDTNKEGTKNEPPGSC